MLAQEKGVGIVEIKLAHAIPRSVWRCGERSSAVGPPIQQPRIQLCLVVLPNDIDWNLIVRQLVAVPLYKQVEVFTPQIRSIAPYAIPLRHGSSSSAPGARKTVEYHDSELANQSHASTRVVLNSRKN